VLNNSNAPATPTLLGLLGAATANGALNGLNGLQSNGSSNNSNSSSPSQNNGGQMHNANMNLPNGVSLAASVSGTLPNLPDGVANPASNASPFHVKYRLSLDGYLMFRWMVSWCVLQPSISALRLSKTRTQPPAAPQENNTQYARLYAISQVRHRSLLFVCIETSYCLGF
jgi:hypothetical protein